MTADNREHASASNDQKSSLPVDDLQQQEVDRAAAEKVKGGLANASQLSTAAARGSRGESSSQ